MIFGAGEYTYKVAEGWGHKSFANGVKPDYKAIHKADMAESE